MLSLLIQLVVSLRLVFPGPSDGLYLRSGERSGEPYGGRVETAELWSLDNANTRFSLSVSVPFDTDIGPTSVVLVVGDARFVQNGGGSSGSERSTLHFTIEGATPAAAVGRHFGIEPRLREHPGHRLRIEFVPPDATVTAGEPVPVTLRLTNVGDVPVRFMQGGRNRAPRDNQYVFSTRLLGRQVEDVGSSWHHGGLAASRTIEPGGTFEDTVDLRSWFAFEEPGTYEVLGSYFMAHMMAHVPGMISRSIWEDWATASFVVQVEAASR